MNAIVNRPSIARLHLLAHPAIAHAQDMRREGFGIVVTLKPGHFFAQPAGCSVAEFENYREALEVCRAPASIYTI